MKSLRVINHGFVLLSGLLLSGCIKYYDLAEAEFPQATKVPSTQVVTDNYKRSVAVYDQFETKAHFDALWLSEDVRTAYVNQFADKRGMTIEAKEELLKRQLEETRHWLTFYVLVEQRGQQNTSLSDPLTAWTTSVHIDKHVVAAESIKECDLEAEYQHLFGKSFNAFKSCYLVKFPLNPGQVWLLNKQTYKDMQLMITSPIYKVALAWNQEQINNPKKELSSNEDFYWG